MSRLPEIATKDQLSEDAHAVFDAIAESRGRVRGPFSILLHSPELAGRAAHLGAFVRFESSVPPEVRELAVLLGAHLWRCEYEWSAHLPQAQRVGVRPEAIAAIERDADLEAFTADEALVVTNPEVSSVRDSDRILGMLASKTKRAIEGLEPVKEHLLITRYNPARVNQGQMLSLEDIQDIKTFLGVKSFKKYPS